jgi:gas vesicle protein
MKGRILTGIAAGALMGAAASMIMMPQMSYKNRRRASRISRRLVHDTGSIMDGIRGYIK